jgi:hypothetical protein
MNGFEIPKWHLQNPEGLLNVWAYIFGEPYDAVPYPRGLCSIITCTQEEETDKNKNFRLHYNPQNLFYRKE